jgi:hypothetical protein
LNGDAESSCAVYAFPDTTEIVIAKINTAIPSNIIAMDSLEYCPNFECGLYPTYGLDGAE